MLRAAPADRYSSPSHHTALAGDGFIGRPSTAQICVRIDGPRFLRRTDYRRILRVPVGAARGQILVVARFATGRGNSGASVDSLVAAQFRAAWRLAPEPGCADVYF